MPDVADFAVAISSLQAAFDLAKTFIGIHDQTIIREKAIELQGKITSAQASAVAAQANQATSLKRVAELEKEVADLKAWDAEKKNYQLTNVRPPNAPGGKAWAYALKEKTGSTEPPHLLCERCYQDGCKSILQEESRDLGRINVLFCPRCGLEISRTGVWSRMTPRYGAPKPPNRPR